MDVSFLVLVVVLTALAFDFTNGFHDAANAMATTIATGALKPRTAVVLSGVLNLIGALLSTEVARTVSGGIVDDQALSSTGVNGTAIIFAGLIGAILWNLITWLLGLPSSSSHALFGGLIGAVWVVLGSDAVHVDKVISKIVLPAVIAPIVCGVIAMVCTFLAYAITRRANEKAVLRGFRRGQMASASLVSLAHGTGDAQKTMGVITLVLIVNGHQSPGSDPQGWVILAAGLAIGLGTAVGGWRIIRTLGKGLTDIDAPQGFSSGVASTAVLLSSAHLGFALSTTQVASGGVLGAGLGDRDSVIRWRIAGRIATGWLFTLPIAAVVGAIAAKIAAQGGVGVFAVAAGAIVAVGLIVRHSRRSPVTAHNVNDGPADAAAASTDAAGAKAAPDLPAEPTLRGA